ncbi:MAG TPA: hypothetical protein VKX30_05535 [Flavobacteriaceae bacterium]|nr:hypothetical protein [Flavobacteriaceae bacterium]
MKKNVLLGVSYLLFIFGFLFFLSSCSADGVGNDLNLKELDSSYFESHSQPATEDGKTTYNTRLIIIDIAKPRNDCKDGLGVCRICLICGPVKDNPREIVARMIEEEEGDFVLLELNKEILDNEYDTTLVIEENVYDESTGSYLLIGKYELDKEMGAFGGYKIPIKINK